MTAILTEEQRDWLTLIMVPGIGSTHFIRLLARFHTPKAVLAASEGALREIVGPALATQIKQYAETADIEGQESRMKASGATLVTLEDSAYPTRLAEIYDPPLALFVRGRHIDPDAPCVAVVGTRRPTPYGVRMAEKFARELSARGITVVSGMASGIDAAAHRGALEGGGRTAAVLGCGVDIVYPLENEQLMNDIIRHGSVMSQFTMGTKPSKGHFPYRNRIISGLSLATLVVEAPSRSGALITARQAAEQGREVFAVPGQIGVLNSAGPHALIREGAKLVETVDDILVDLELPASARQPQPATVAPGQAWSGSEPAREHPVPAPERAPVQPTTAPKPAVTGVERDILSVLSPEGSFVDEIAAACRISISEALSSLTLLELKGLVRQFSGKRFAPA